MSAAAAAADGGGSGGFTFPFFYHYPPYFTLQPVRETRDKQRALWKELILRYCRHARLFVLDIEDDEAATNAAPLFANNSIDRKLSNEARQEFLDALVAEGRAEWLDKSRRKCLVLWRTVDEWANIIYTWVRDSALADSVVTLDEMISGDDTIGTELHGMDRAMLVRALRFLQDRGKARMFKGATADDEGVKFFA
eukprot:jgi/Chlat1/6338/Chrsp44S05905